MNRRINVIKFWGMSIMFDSCSYDVEDKLLFLAKEGVFITAIDLSGMTLKFDYWVKCGDCGIKYVYNLLV